MSHDLPYRRGRGRPHLRVVLAQPRGFCAGVRRAIEIVERALTRFGAPIYVRHEIVHNKHVVADLRARGARFVEDVDEIPEGAVVVFSAHGVSRAVEQAARARRLRVVDATCPLVAKVHAEGHRYAAAGYDVVLIGHAGHPEVVGTLGRIDVPVHVIAQPSDVAALRPRDPERLAYVTQTTLSVDDTRAVIAALKARFPAIQGPDVNDICYATQNRQAAARRLITEAEVDVLLVAGARNSSNTNRLREIGAQAGVPSHLVETACEVDPAWLVGVKAVGITAGASAPEGQVRDIVAALGRTFALEVSVLDGPHEQVQFKLPPEVAAPAPEGSPCNAAVAAASPARRQAPVVVRRGFALS
ncbi:MAG: 4-hydroxy-3-methylbut-2-enyl diphosphate reductase [Alphaproteobacteria bacterium]|nr:MAG: 4-hydroxy-3-methylbut-2-enyl diphosphate reductase [Alphaproteobacteria bacterium]